MKKLLLGLLFLAAPAFGATVTLSTGAACDYGAITYAANGSAFVSCVNVAIVTPLPNPPTPTPPAPPVAGNYEAAGMWLYQNRQMRTGVLQAGDQRETGFTVPSGYSGYPEIGISGLNLKVFVDGVEVADGPFATTPGPHTLRVRAVGSAEGTVTLYH